MGEVQLRAVGGAGQRRRGQRDCDFLYGRFSGRRVQVVGEYGEWDHGRWEGDAVEGCAGERDVWAESVVVVGGRVGRWGGEGMGKWVCCFAFVQGGDTQCLV